ncbi:MAG TPA: GntR family transcriptional regulator [Acidimicrobiales bacterium]|nr:GntR family transcriptional regulator [Acidimicrobiales bacterium]
MSSELEPDPLVARQHAAEVYGELKRRIIELAMAPGMPLCPEALAAELGASPADVRVAVTRLRGDGLVTATGADVRVTPVDMKAAEDVLSLRDLLEGEAVATAARAGIDVFRAHELQRLCDATVHVEGGSTRSSRRANTVFHVALARTGGNDVLADVLERVLTQLERLFNLGVPAGACAEDTIYGHNALLAAAIAGDVDGARSLALGHAQRTRDMVLKTIAWREALVAGGATAGPAAG